MAVSTELLAPIVSLTLDRPKANAFDQEQLDALGRALGEVESVEGARALLVLGKGDKAFSAGADLGGLGPLAEPTGLARWTAQAHALLDRIAGLPFPAIAVIERPAAGGGFELALACHFRVMARDAHLSLPEIRRGYLPSWAGLERLVPLVGLGFAADMLLTGRRVSADEALARGIVHRVADDPRAAARELAESFAALPPLALRAGLEQLAGIGRGDERSAVRARELADLERLVRTEDTVEGVLAFLEKREPAFKGR